MSPRPHVDIGALHERIESLGAACRFIYAIAAIEALIIVGWVVLS